MEVAQGLQYKADRAKRGAMVKAANPLNEVVKVRASRGQPLKGHQASVGDRLQRVHQMPRSSTTSLHRFWRDAPHSTDIAASVSCAC